MLGQAGDPTGIRGKHQTSLPPGAPQFAGAVGVPGTKQIGFVVQQLCDVCTRIRHPVAMSGETTTGSQQVRSKPCLRMMACCGMGFPMASIAGDPQFHHLGAPDTTQEQHLHQKKVRLMTHAGSSIGINRLPHSTVTCARSSEAVGWRPSLCPHCGSGP